VNEISDKFIDLGLDEGNHSGYGQDMMLKQEKFRKEFDKYAFTFETNHLNIPKGHSDTDTLFEQ
jgi:hypothetical protein